MGAAEGQGGRSTFENFARDILIQYAVRYFTIFLRLVDKRTLSLCAGEGVQVRGLQRTAHTERSAADHTPGCPLLVLPGKSKATTIPTKLFGIRLLVHKKYYTQDDRTKTSGA